VAIHPYCAAITLRWTGNRQDLKEVGTVKTRFVLAAAVTAVCVALLAGKDDVRRFWRMRNM
jgi:hypothetical protein